MKYTKYYCNCNSYVETKGRIKKDGTRAIWQCKDLRKYALTDVDLDGVCVLCGHYAVANAPSGNSHKVEERVTEAKLRDRSYMSKRYEAVGDYYCSKGRLLL